MNFFQRCGELAAGFYGWKPHNVQLKIIENFYTFVKQRGPFSNPEIAFEEFKKYNKRKKYDKNTKK